MGGSGLYVRKSGSAVNRSWVAVGDDKSLFLAIYTEDVAGYAFCLYVGEIFSLKPSDPYRAVLIARSATGTAGSSEGVSAILNASGGTLTAVNSGNYIERDHTGASLSVAVGKDTGALSAVDTFSTASGSHTFPNIADGSVIFCPFRVMYPIPASSQTNQYLRRFPAIFNLLS